MDIRRIKDKLVIEQDEAITVLPFSSIRNIHMYKVYGEYIVIEDYSNISRNTMIEGNKDDFERMKSLLYDYLRYGE